jgi:hypothetical protein
MHQTNAVEEIKTPILISVNFFPKVVPYMKCWINKATDTHSEYVTLIAFAVQKSSYERATVFRYTYMAYLIRYRHHFNSAPYSVLFYHQRWVISVSECIVIQALDTFFSLKLRGLCDELITRPKESYRLWCFVVGDLETSWMRRARPNGGSRPQNKQTYVTGLML